VELIGVRNAGFVLLGLIACATGNAVTPASASSELKECRTAIGTPPSKNEFAAVLAACEDNSGPPRLSGRLRSAPRAVGDQISRHRSFARFRLSVSVSSMRRTRLNTGGSHISQCTRC
jgi:hypothetical protein